MANPRPVIERVITATIVSFILSAILTLVEVGFDDEAFWFSFLRSWAIAWPLAAFGTNLVAPIAQWLAGGIVACLPRRLRGEEG
ncbi:MAG: DUF2798 domain-containing protein [Paracoccaceae bacterium]